jgi:hypothetical protein
MVFLWEKRNLKEKVNETRTQDNPLGERVSNGKGSHRRPTDESKVAKNWPFPDRKPKQWPRGKDGKLKE